MSLTRWLPHGWEITIHNLRLGPWQYEAGALGLESIHGPPPGCAGYRSQREAARSARKALRHRAFFSSTTGWSDTGTAHAMTGGHAYAWCDKRVPLRDGPLRGKESPKCRRCERILDQLVNEFPDDDSQRKYERG